MMISTIGYEGAALTDFIDTLHRAEITQVLDIRDVPVSRRPGFSKNVLARALEPEGISYRHFKPLGDPKPGREAARSGHFELFEEIYRAHLTRPEAQKALQELVDAAKSEQSVLLCYERSYEHCHRTLVAEAMQRLTSFTIRNLGVQKARPAGERGRNATAGTGSVAIA